MNNLGRKARIIVGQNLKIPGVASSTVTPVSLKYKVKSGDTACQIAQRYAVSCEQVLVDNNLGRKGAISVGQILLIGGRSSKTSANVAVSKYTVRSGDTACGIAEQFDVPCSTLIRSNRLGKKASLRVGQELKIANVVGPAAVSDELDSQQHGWLAKVDALPDMTLITRADHVSLKVLPDETLAHYADWMGSRNSGSIRRMNNLSPAAEPRLGQSIRLPISSSKTRELFKSRRSEFHQVLTEEFKERFSIKEVKSVKIKSGQSLWSIAQKYETPMWVLIRYNPGLGSALQPGQVIDVALIERK